CPEACPSLRCRWAYAGRTQSRRQAWVSPFRMRMLFSQFERASCKKGNRMEIAGSSAIVVGGAGGLGEATVRRLHGSGAKVVVADLADDKGKELESELGVRYVRTDATSEESVNAAIAEAS